MKDKVFNLLPPAMIALVLCFWAFGPKSLLDHPATIIAAGPVIVIIVLLLEQVKARRAANDQTEPAATA